MFFFPIICHVFQLAAVNLQENDRNFFNLLNPLNEISEGVTQTQKGTLVLANYIVILL